MYPAPLFWGMRHIGPGEDLDDVRDELGMNIGERGDLVAVNTADIGRSIRDGDRVDVSYNDIDELRTAMEEIARILAMVEELQGVSSNEQLEEVRAF